MKPHRQIFCTLVQKYICIYVLGLYCNKKKVEFFCELFLWYI